MPSKDYIACKDVRKSAQALNMLGVILRVAHVILDDKGYSIDQIFRLLVFSRILAPASKKGTFDGKDFYFEDFGDFSRNIY